MNLSNFFSESDLKKYSKFVLIILVGLILLGMYFFWIPKYQEFQKNKRILESKDEEIKLKKEYLRELNGHLSNVLEHEEELAIIKEGLPLGYSLPTLYSFVQSAASRNRVILTNIGYQKGSSIAKDEGNDLKKIGLVIDAEGEYSSLKNFISVLHKNSRFFNIADLKFSSPQETDRTIGNVFEFNLKIDVAYY